MPKRLDDFTTDDLRRECLLAPNDQVSIESLKYPLMALPKYDGQRLVQVMRLSITRSGKNQPNLNVPGHLAPLVDFCVRRRVVLDAELWSPDMTFSELESVLGSRNKPIPPSVRAYVFDCLTLDEWLGRCPAPPYRLRWKAAEDVLRQADNRGVCSVMAPCALFDDPASLRSAYDRWLDQKFEGAILRSPDASYKFGRATVRQNIIFKMKEFITVDGQLVGIEEREKMVDGFRTSADRGVDEFGRPKRTHKAENYESADNAGALVVRAVINGKTVETKLGWARGWGMKARQEIWDAFKANPSEWIGRWVEFRYMPHGTKDKPRIPGFIRFRPDLDRAKGASLG